MSVDSLSDAHRKSVGDGRISRRTGNGSAKMDTTKNGLTFAWHLTSGFNIAWSASTFSQVASMQGSPTVTFTSHRFLGGTTDGNYFLHYCQMNLIRRTINPAISAQWALITSEIPTHNRHISCHIRIIRRIENSFDLLLSDEIRIFPESFAASHFIRPKKNSLMLHVNN